MALKPGDAEGWFALQTAGVIKVCCLSTAIEEIENAYLCLPAWRERAANIEIPFAIAAVLRELAAIRERMGAQPPPLQAARPTTQSVDKDADRLDKIRGVRDKWPGQAKGGQSARTITGPGKGQIAVEFKPSERVILSRDFNTLPPAWRARLIAAQICIVDQFGSKILLEGRQLNGQARYDVGS